MPGRRGHGPWADERRGRLDLWVLAVLVAMALGGGALLFASGELAYDPPTEVSARV